MFAIKEFGDIKNILVIGAGGTSKALVSRFLQEGIDVTVLNRSKNRLTYFQTLNCTCHTWDDFEIKKYDLVVNTTSAGLKDEELPMPKEMCEDILDNTSFVADAIYGKLTPFLKLAKKKNLTFKDGADMLLGQGVLANELFVKFALKKENIKTQMQKSFLL
jgi:shikimate dehydrogenase